MWVGSLHHMYDQRKRDVGNAVDTEQGTQPTLKLLQTLKFYLQISFSVAWTNWYLPEVMKSFLV